VIKKKDKRIEIEDAAKIAVSKFFKDKGRLRRWLEEGYDLCKVLDHTRMPVLNQVSEMVPATHFDILDSHDVNTVERTVTKVAAVYEGRIELRTEYLHSSPPKLEGDYAPMISRQDDWEVPADALEFMQNSTNVPLRLSMPDFELALKYRETLPGYDPVTERNEQEIFLPERAIAEFVRVGDTVFYIVVNKADRRIRVYAFARGTMHPANCKTCRNMTRTAEYFPVDDAELGIWYEELQQGYGLDYKLMEHIIQPENGLAFLMEHGHKQGFPQVTEARAFLEARDTGMSNYLCYIDAYASGPTIIDCSMGMPGAAERADASRPDFKHHYRRYAEHLWSNPKFKGAVGGVPNGMTLEQYLQLLRNEIKPAPVSGVYGAGGSSMSLSVLGHPTDNEDETSLEDVRLQLPQAFQNWKPVQAEKWVSEFVDTFKQPLAMALKKAFPGVARLHSGLQSHWTRSVGKDNRGTPPTILSPDGHYVYQSSILRRNKDVHYGLKYKCPITDEHTTVQRMPLELNRGIELGANGTHMLDALILRLAANRNAEQGIPTVTIHDSEGVPRFFRRQANRNYVWAFNYVLSLPFWQQFGIHCGPFQSLDRNAVLLGR